MIKYKGNPRNNIVEIYINDKITQSDFEQITTQLKADLQKHGQLRILEQVNGNCDMKSIMLLKDLLFGLSPTNDFTHAALVTDAKWVKTYVRAIDNVLSANVKTFESAHIDRARALIANA